MRWSVVQELLKGDAPSKIYPSLFRLEEISDSDVREWMEERREARWKLVHALARIHPEHPVVRAAQDVIMHNQEGLQTDTVLSIRGSELLSWLEPEVVGSGECRGEAERPERESVTSALRDIKDACELLFEEEDVTRILKAYFDTEDQPHAGTVVVGAPEAV